MSTSHKSVLPPPSGPATGHSKKSASTTKVIPVGVRRLEEVLCSSNFDVFKNRNSMIK